MPPKHGVGSSNLPGRATLFDLYIQQIAVVALFPFGTNRKDWRHCLRGLQVQPPPVFGDGPKLCLMEEWKDAESDAQSDRFCGSGSWRFRWPRRRRFESRGFSRMLQACMTS